MITAGFGIIMALTLRPSGPASFVRPAETRAVASASGDGANRDVSLLLRNLNDERRARGLAGLVLDARLCAIAERHVLDMISRRYFAHVSPEGVTPFARMSQANYRFGYAGENLALDRDAESAHRSLVASREHHDNMVEPHYARVGIAALPGSMGEIVVEDFSD